MRILSCLIIAVCTTSLASGHEETRRQIRLVSEQIDQQQPQGAVTEKARSLAALHLRRGELHRILRDWQEAKQDYDRAATLDPTMTAVTLARTQMYLDLCRPDLALEQLAPTLERTPTLAKAWLLRAQAHALDHQYLLAVENQQQALTLLHRPLPEHFAEAAEWLLAAAEPGLERSAEMPTGSPAELSEQALGWLDQGLERLPGCISLELKRLQILVDLERHDTALNHTRRLLRSASRKEQWYLHKAEVLMHAERLPAAAAAYREGVHCILQLPPHIQHRSATKELMERLTNGYERAIRLQRGSNS